MGLVLTVAERHRGCPKAASVIPVLGFGTSLVLRKWQHVGSAPMGGSVEYSC